MFGTLSEEVEVKVAADKAWQLYGTIKIRDIAIKYIVDGIEVVEGEGDVGTIVKVTFKPGYGIPCYKEKYTKMDHVKRVREAEIIEGGYLDFGFTRYRVGFGVRNNPNDETGASCLVKTTIEYEVTEEAAANVSLAVIIKPFVDLMKFANERISSSG